MNSDDKLVRILHNKFYFRAMFYMVGDVNRQRGIMSERIAFSNVELGDRQIIAVQKVGQRALEIAEERYCSGFPDYKGGIIKKLGHNNARHNRRVGDDAARLVDVQGFSTGIRQLARVAGYAHDLRQLTGRGNDERESAEWVEKHLRDTQQLPGWMAELAAKAIWGTLPLFENGRLVDQTANRMEFASRDEELFVKGLASADLSELYTPFGPYVAHMLYAQHRGKEPGETPDMSGLLEFQQKQVIFLDEYEYPIPEARFIFATHEAEVRKYVELVCYQLESGEITTWDQLIAQDIAFMNDPYGDFSRQKLELVTL